MKTIILDSPSKALKVKLASAPYTLNPDFIVSWADNTGAVFTEGSTDGILNGTTIVTLVDPPGAATRRIIKAIAIANRDTAPVVVSIIYDNAGTQRIIQKVTLQTNETWTLDGVYDAAGRFKSVGEKGDTGKGISSTSYNASTGILTITFTDSTTYQTGDIRGATGATGATGKGISSSSYNASTGILTITFTDASTYSTGDLRGATGATGKGISSSSYNAGTGVLTITFTDSSTYQTGDLRGSIPEAPSDGKQYARKDGAWAEVTSSAAGSSFWTSVAGTPIRTSNTTFTVTGDYAALFGKGLILKWTESAVVKVAMVSIPATYSSPNTTVTVIGDTMASIDANSLKYCLIGVEAFTARFGTAGNIGAVATDITNAFYATEPCRVIGADLQVGTSGTTNSTTIDVNKNGTTMFTTKPTLATTVASSPTPFTADSGTSLALGDRVSIDLDAVQTTNAVDLYVQLYLFPTRYLNL